MIDFLENKKILIISIISILILSGFGTSIYFYAKFQQLKENPQLVIQNETKNWVDKVGKLMELPTDEMPTILTVDDKTKLSDRPFFQNAENGDVVLAYSKAMEAILYRPSYNKIIEVSAFNSTSFASNSSSTASTTAKISVIIRNGTVISGLANLVAKKVLTNKNIDVVAVGNALNRTYATTLVVDNTGNHALQASEIAVSLGGSVGVLPVGEIKSNSDILIIAGQDMKSL